MTVMKASALSRRATVALVSAVASSVEAKSNGVIGFNATMRYVTNSKGELVVIARSGEIVIHDEHGRERERHKVPYGATLTVKADQQIKAGTILANWDPLTRPIITESSRGGLAPYPLVLPPRHARCSAVAS